jgi:arsenate reductase/ArsR family transcriptional regulator
MIDSFEILTKALADGSRLRLLKLLEDGEVCVCVLTDSLGLAPATVSKHLSLLKAAGLIQARKDGRWVHYRLHDAPAPAAAALLAVLRDHVSSEAASPTPCCE